MKWGDNENTSEGSNPEMPVPIFGKFNFKPLDQFNPQLRLNTILKGLNVNNPL